MRRVSLNTTLKDARIFDEDSWEAETEFLANLKKKSPKRNDPWQNAPIDDERNDPWDSDSASSIPKTVKAEPIDDERYDPWENESKSEPWQIDDAVSTPITIKKERCFDEKTPGRVKRTRSSVPIKTEQFFDENTASPMKQERIDFELKLKFDNDESANGNSCDDRKANLRETRSGLKRRIDSGEPPSTPKKRLSSTSSTNSSPEHKKFKDDETKRKKKEIEKDPEILRRRQKQIDYGKNTIGYDKYTQSVPKHQRSRGDPQTPDKYRKYSRRGWDGLIKQWRVKLHNYDPA